MLTYRIPECSLLSQIISELAIKFPTTKFLKSIASLCIANFPDSSLPALFIYQNGNLKKQLIGSHTFGGTKMTAESKAQNKYSLKKLAFIYTIDKL